MQTAGERFHLTSQIIERVWGRRVLPSVGLAGLRLLQTVSGAAIRWERHKSSARAPLVVVGNPRSGTTFLHRHLIDAGWGQGVESWQFAHSSAIQQALVRPLLPLLSRVRGGAWQGTPHTTSLRAAETEDAFTAVHHLDGLLWYAYILAFDEEDHFERFLAHLDATTARDIHGLRDLWARCIPLDGRPIGKLFSASARLPALLEDPEVRIAYVIRDPVLSIPSALDLVRQVLENTLGFDHLPQEVRRRWAIRMVRALTTLLARAVPELGRPEVMVIPHERLLADFARVMHQLAAHVSHEWTAEQQVALREQATRQRARLPSRPKPLGRFLLEERDLSRARHAHLAAEAHANV